jgi:hypothetical protein
MKCKVRALMLMLLMCWASQSSAQPTRAKKNYVMGTCIGTYQIEKDSEYNDSNTYLETSAGLGGG